jgi:hypothetical protein
VRAVKRSIYRIHGLMPYPDDLFRTKFGATFEDHLNAEVAPLFSHGGEPIRFEMGGEDFRTVFESAENEDFDFIFTFPNMAGCLEAEFGASPLLTMRNLRRGMELNMYGGIIFTRADRDDINSVHDLRDKRVDAVDVLMMQHQWMVFKENSMDMFNDLGQLHFSGKESNMLQAVLDGRADAGFHRTGLWLHRVILGVSKLINLDPPVLVFNVHNHLASNPILPLHPLFGLQRFRLKDLSKCVIPSQGPFKVCGTSPS